MAKLLIWGHTTRGQEVIEILEMLGGKNTNGYVGDASYSAYSINKQGTIDNHMFIRSPFVALFTLEEFLEKFPYKVGDRVKNVYGSSGKIYAMKWIDDVIQYRLDFGHHTSGWYAVNELQPYKKETMKETVIDTIKENEDRYRIKVNHQFDIEVDEGEYYAVRRKPQYPKTYKECCDVLLISPYYNLRYHTYQPGYHEFPTSTNELLLLEDKLNTLGKLIICRDAYWKIINCGKLC